MWYNGILLDWYDIISVCLAYKDYDRILNVIRLTYTSFERPMPLSKDYIVSFLLSSTTSTFLSWLRAGGRTDYHRLWVSYLDDEAY